MDHEIWAGDAEDWEIVMRLLPAGWQEKARELGALRRTREFTDAATLLRVLFIHLAEGCSLRETAVRAAQGELVKVSDVALLKRLRVSGEWFRWMGEELIRQWALPAPAHLLLEQGMRIRLVDGTTVSEPSQGESLRQFAVRAGDLLIADRGFANRSGVRHVQQHGGSVIVRLNLTNLPLAHADGRAFALLAHLRRVRAGHFGDWPVCTVPERKALAPLTGRVCAIKKSKAAAARGRERAEREARKQGHQVRPETLEAAGYLFVFTTLGEHVPAATVLEMYRGRWQVELAFKRLKALLSLGHLKKFDPEGAQAWLQGKLLVAILLETLISVAARFSPWGYPLQTQALPMAGEHVHAAPA